MRNRFLYFPVAVVTFFMGYVLVPYDAADFLPDYSLTPTSPVVSCRTGNWGNSDLSDYYGYWGGSGGIVMVLNQYYITDAEQRKSYRYEIVRHINNPHENAYVLRLIGLDAGSNLRNYVYLGFSDDGWMGYYGYNSLDDYYQTHFTAGGSFYRYAVK